MKSENEISRRLESYGAARLIYLDGKGLIAWHAGTGENVEILFLEVDERQRRKGVATGLVRRMASALLAEFQVPYHSVYVFRREANGVAGAFYRSLGFSDGVPCGIYKGEQAMLHWVEFDKLTERLWGVQGAPLLLGHRR